VHDVNIIMMTTHAYEISSLQQRSSYQRYDGAQTRRTVDKLSTSRFLEPKKPPSTTNYYDLSPE
jgi:hypothetical protein